MKLLIGGSPCTHWSIAQIKHRETEPAGLGWELFKNYLIAREKYKPDFFLYENNKSMSRAIREQITKELGVEPIMVNSALVSAQTRRRLYWVGERNPDGTYRTMDVKQPENREILLRDILMTTPTGICNAPAMRVREGTKRGYVDILPGTCVDLAHPNSETRRGRQMDDKSNCLTTSCELYEYCGTLDAPIYQMEDGDVVIDGKRYPTKLRDNRYIIRKLTVGECKRLQTVPDEYVFPVSDNQAYKMLGNGWTVEVIAHILGHIPGIATEPLEVLSMYDGMSCGHIALDRLTANVAKYYATEIDKYAIQSAMANYPDTIQLGDAYDIRRNDWALPGPAEAAAAQETEPTDLSAAPEEIKEEIIRNAERLEKPAPAKPARKVRVRVRVRRRRAVKT